MHSAPAATRLARSTRMRWIYCKETGFRRMACAAKTGTSFAAPNAPVMDYVLTVCDKAAGEVCPIWPGQPMSAHWGVEDPAAVQGDEDAVNKAFKDAFILMSRRISLFLSLPIDKLDKLSLQKELVHIGQTTD